MPLKLPEGLPAIEQLHAENIFLMHHERALKQDIRPLRIALLNLMPKKAETETQLLRLLSNTPLQMEVTLLYTESYRSKHTPPEYLKSFYRTLSDVRQERFDGLIVTGAPIEVMDYQDVTYWEEFKQVLHWADRNVFSTMFICWAALAALYYCYGIHKFELAQKLSGVFAHRRLSAVNPLTRGFDDIFYAPHSRKCEVKTEDLLKIPSLEVLSTSEEAGLYLACTKNGSQVFVMGHGEYEADTLKQEYERDLGKGLSPELPLHYFPGDDPQRPPHNTWRGHGSLLFSNWLNYFVYQETPFDLSELGG